MTYEESRHYIDRLKPAGMQMGLTRMEAAMAALASPEKQLRTVHIAGTNGKGSTARMLAAALTAGGYKTGLYTSPAVTGLRDTITIDGEPIGKAAFAAAAAQVRDAVPTGLSEFEFVTALTLYWFAEQRVDIAVLECGLGGETDATNVLPPPLCAVFTPIGLDHTALLGDTVQAIALQKSGIAKAPCDMVCAPSMDEDALAALMNVAAQKGLTVHLPTLPKAEETAAGVRFSYGGETYQLRLHGIHQAENAVTALTVLNCLAAKGFAVAPTAAKAAMESVTMPCRIEVLQKEPLLLADGAHNPQGVEALCTALRALAVPPLTLVIGMLRDKNTAACLSLLAPFCARMICCTPQGTPRALPAEELAQQARLLCPTVAVTDTPQQALAQALALGSPVLVGGSFYTAVPARRAFLEKQP